MLLKPEDMLTVVMTRWDVVTDGSCSEGVSFLKDEGRRDLRVFVAMQRERKRGRRVDIPFQG